MDASPATADRLRPLVGDLRQLASVRRIVLDDGPERGVTALALSSGGGMDLWLMAGRALDIGALWFRGRPVAWQSPTGFSHPALGAPELDDGRGFERLFSGFMVTCGLDQIRGPQNGSPLHGRLGSRPARVLSACEQWDAPQPAIEVVGEVVQHCLAGESLRLRRTVRLPIGGTSVQWVDEVTNEGPMAQPHELLYHLNFGYPAIASGSRVEAGGRTLAGPLTLPDTAPVDEAQCSAAPAAGVTVSTPLGGGRSLTIQIKQDITALPWLQLWRDLRPTRGVLSVEPCTTPRGPEARSVLAPTLQPGECRRYQVELNFAETD